VFESLLLKARQTISSYFVSLSAMPFNLRYQIMRRNSTQHARTGRTRLARRWWSILLMSVRRPRRSPKRSCPTSRRGQCKRTWAEEFAVNAGVVNPASPFLQLTDKIFINNNFKCSVYDVHIYSSTGIPPTTTQISGNGCGPFTQSQLK